MVQYLTDERMYSIVASHDRRFDGVFYFSALDSEVYCVPSCRVRTPLPRKIRFYYTQADAEADGLRPCRRCRPDLVASRNLADVRQRS